MIPRYAHTQQLILQCADWQSLRRLANGNCVPGNVHSAVSTQQITTCWILRSMLKMNEFNFSVRMCHRRLYLSLSSLELVMLIGKDLEPRVQQHGRQLMWLQSSLRGSIMQHVIALLAKEERHVRCQRVAVRHEGCGVDIAHAAHTPLYPTCIHAPRVCGHLTRCRLDRRWHGCWWC